MHNEFETIDPTKIAHIFNVYLTHVSSDLAKNIQSNINNLSYINTTLDIVSIPNQESRRGINSYGYDFLPTKFSTKIFVFKNIFVTLPPVAIHI